LGKTVRNADIEENVMNPRVVGVLPTFFYHLVVMIFIGGCSAPSHFFHFADIPPADELPIDGIWQLPDRTVALKVDRGRMYIHEGDGCLPPRGSIVMKNIKPMKRLNKYKSSCVGFWIESSKRFKACEIVVTGDSSISIRVSTPNPILTTLSDAFVSRDLRELRQELWRCPPVLPRLNNKELQKLVLDNESWFLEAYKRNSATTPVIAQSSSPILDSVASTSRPTLIKPPPPTPAQPSVTTAADTLETHKKALNIIDDFADRICITVQQTGTSNNAELSGEAKIELNELLKKIANLGIKGAAKFQTSEWKGVLHQDLEHRCSNA
jgi:hypothetical protein